MNFLDKLILKLFLRTNIGKEIKSFFKIKNDQYATSYLISKKKYDKIREKLNKNK